MELNAGLRGTARRPGQATGVFLRTGAMSGLLSAGLGIAGGLLEGALTGPWPDAADPGYGQYLAANRAPILAQSLLFVFSSAALLWFLGFVRGRLRCAEPAPGTVSAIAFGAGVLAVGLNILGQAAQITLTLPSQGNVPPDVAAAVADLCLVTLNLANLPAGVMFLAIALASLRLSAYPLWLGWTAAAAAAASFLSVISLVPPDGPLSPTGGLTTALRLVPLLWYVPAAVVMLRRSGSAPRAAGQTPGGQMPGGQTTGGQTTAG